MKTKLIVAATLTFFAGAAEASQHPDRIAITPASDRGAIVLRTPRLKEDYVIGIAAYNPATQVINGGLLGNDGSITVHAANKKSAIDPDSDLVIRDLKPGTYTVTTIAWQGFWADCFYNNTLQFIVAAGQVVYLGTFAAPSALAELQRNTQRSGQTVSFQSRHYEYFDGIAAPIFFDGENATALAHVAAWLKVASPGTVVPPIPVGFAPAKFGTGSSLFGERLCVGYLSKPPKSRS